MTAILIMYLIVGVLFTLLSVSKQFDFYYQNDMVTKFCVLTYLILGWPYYVIKSIEKNLRKNC